MLIGYPLVVLWIAKRWPRPTRTDIAYEPQVTVLLAVRNGGAWLRKKLTSISRQSYPQRLLRIVVVSDGSTDDTDEIVESFSADGMPVTLVQQEAQGKAAALTLAQRHIDSGAVVLTDARQELDPNCISELMRVLGDPTVGAVSGVLLPKDRNDVNDQTGGLYWRMETALRVGLGTIDSMLGATGPIYAMRREEMRPIPTGLILDDMYLPLGAFFRGKRLVTAPAAIAWEEPMLITAEFQRKVRTAAGNYQLLRHEPRLLSPARNRMFWHYLSYKLGRLLLPHLLLLQFAVALTLPSPFRTVVLAGHALVVLLVSLDRLLPSASAVRRITSPLRSFSSLMFAAFLSQRIFVRGTEGLWVPTGTRKP